MATSTTSQLRSVAAARGGDDPQLVALLLTAADQLDLAYDGSPPQPTPALCARNAYRILSRVDATSDEWSALTDVASEWRLLALFLADHPTAAS